MRAVEPLGKEWYNNRYSQRRTCGDYERKNKAEEGEKMAGYLIKDTTREEREQIVADSLGNIDATCDGCMAGLADMYQDYIDGKKEIREITMEFNARYVKGDNDREEK